MVAFPGRAKIRVGRSFGVALADIMGIILRFSGAECDRLNVYVTPEVIC